MKQDTITLSHTGAARPAPKAQSVIRREVIALAMPAMGEQLLSMVVGIVHTFLVGHLGAAPLAAVGLAQQWVMMAVTLFSATGTGATAMIARFVGAQEPENVDRVLRQAVLMAAGLGLVAAVLGVSLARPAVLLLGAPADVVDFSTDYLRVATSVLFFSFLMFIGNACLRGAGDTRTPLYVMLVVNVVNVVVAWTAINGPFGLPQLGVVGSALGMVAGHLSGSALIMILLLKGRSGLKLRLRGLRVDLDLIRRILHIGLPSGIEQVLMRTGQMFFARILAALGTLAYAANQVAVNGWSLSFMPGFGFALAATTLVGQALGARDPEDAERRGYTAYRIGAVVMSTMGLLLVLFPAQIVSFFIDDPEVIALGILPLRTVGLVQPLLAASMVFAGGLRGAGDTRFPMIMTASTIWFVRLPLGYLFALVFGWGLPGAWAAMALDMSIRGIGNYLRWRSGRWKGIEV